MSFVRDLLFGSPPEPPDYSALSQGNKEIAQMNIDYAKQKDAVASQQLDRLFGLQQRTSDATLALAEKEAARSDDYYNYAKTTFRPLEQEMVNRAMNYNTEAERDRMAGKAAADVSQAFGNAAGQQLRGMARYGIGRPNAAAFGAQNAELLAKEAAGIAGAKTGARFAARDQGNAMMQNAINVGRNYPAVSQASSQLGISGNSAALSGAVGATNAGTASAGIAGNYLNNASGAYNSAANIMNTGFQNSYNNWATQGQQMAAIMDFAGAMYGGKADGGEIGYADGKSPEYGVRYTPGDEPVKGAGLLHGPGSGISDDIPALVSKGEYIVPEDVVKAKGVEFFDKLVSKYHMPAEEQRRRYGIGGKHG